MEIRQAHLWVGIQVIFHFYPISLVQPLWMRHGAPGALGEAAASLVGLVAQAVMG